MLYLRVNVDDYAKQFVKQKLNEVLSFGDFLAEVREVNFISGTGIEIRGLHIFDAQHWDDPIVNVESILVRCPTDINKLVAGTVKPTSIDVKRLQLNVQEADLYSNLKNRIQEVIKHRPPSQLVPLRIRDSMIQFKPLHSETDLVANVHADVIPTESENKKSLKLALRANGTGFSMLQADGEIDLLQRQWLVNVSRCDADLNRKWLEMISDASKLPDSFFNQMAGKLVVQGIAASTFDRPLPQFKFTIGLSEFSMNNRYLPKPVLNSSATIQVDNEKLVVDNAQGQVGDGEFQFSYVQHGLWQPKSWWSKGLGRQLVFDAAFLSKHSEGGRKFCEGFSPAGKFDVQYEIDSSGKKNITGQITDMSFSFHRFPYRVEHCVGNVKWNNDDMTFQMQALEKQQLVEVSGSVKNPGEMATYEFNFGTDGRLPIDAKMLSTLKHFPSVSRAVRDFRSVGFVSGRGKVSKTVPGADWVQKDVRINLHDCNVRHAKFDYPVQDIKGTVLIDDSGFRFSDVQGESGSSSIFCNGNWTPDEGLQLVFKCSQVQLDDRLRNALIPSLQIVWDGIRPAGKIKMGNVFLNLPPDAAYADIRIQAQIGDSISAASTDHVNIYPYWFPYRINNIQGELFIGDGIVKLNHATGKHGQASFGCNGTGSYSENGWSMQIQNLLVGSALLSEELLTALPVDLAAAIRQLQYRGNLNVSGEIGFAGTYNDNQEVASDKFDQVQTVSYETETEDVDVNWDLRMDVDQGEMLIGLPLKNIFGSVRLTGKSKGDISESAGEVSVDSLTLYGMQISNIQGPLWIDNLRTRAGRFTGGKPRSLVGDAFGGKITFDGWVSHVDQYPFLLQSTIKDSQLEQIVSDVTTNFQELSGDGYGFLRLKGNANELHSYNGDGSLHLKNAKIHQLPVILSLLKILNIKELNRTAFDTSNVDFSIDGNNVKLDRIELIGDAISLIGNGYLELMRHANVNFYSVVGRNRIDIPLISNLYKAGSQRIMWINIGGPFNNLQTSRKVLPGLDDSLRRLLRPADFGGVNEPSENPNP